MSSAALLPFPKYQKFGVITRFDSREDQNVNTPSPTPGIYNSAQRIYAKPLKYLLMFHRASSLHLSL